MKTDTCRLEPASVVADRILRGETVVIPTGWPGHATVVVFSNDLVMKGNRGERSQGIDSGISVFAPSSKPTHETLTKAIEKLRGKNLQAHFEENLDTMLNLERVPLNDEEKAFVYRKDQKFGNCTHASTKTALLVLLFVKFRAIPGGLTFRRSATHGLGIIASQRWHSILFATLAVGFSVASHRLVLVKQTGFTGFWHTFYCSCMGILTPRAR